MIDYGLFGEAPDMVLIGTEGFNLNANPKADKLLDKGVFTSKHTLENTFLLVNGSCEKEVICEDSRISDVAEITKNWV